MAFIRLGKSYNPTSNIKIQHNKKINRKPTETSARSRSTDYMFRSLGEYGGGEVASPMVVREGYFHF